MDSPTQPLLGRRKRSVTNESQDTITTQPIPFWPQVWVNTVTNIEAFMAGYAGGFTGVCLAQLRHDKNIQSTISDDAWIVGLPQAGSLLGGFIAMMLTDRMGRKPVIYVSGVVALLGWALAALSLDVNFIFGARFLMGIGMGADTGPRQIYTCEVAPVHLRGFFSSVDILAYRLGILVVYVLGYILPWRGVCAVGVLTLLIFSALMWTLPDSPTHLASRGKIPQAIQAQTWFQRTHEGAEEAVASMTSRNQHRPRSSASWKDFLSARALGPLLILLLPTAAYRLSGSVVVVSYASDLFTSLGLPGDAYTISLLTGALQLLLALPGPLVARMQRQRLLLGVSGAIMSSSLLMAAAGIYWAPTITWIPVAAVWIYLSACIPGLSVALRVLGGEVFPLRFRGALSAALGVANEAFSFVAEVSFPTLLSGIGSDGTFLLMGLVAAFGTFLALPCIPDTKGKTLDQIEDEMSKK